MMNATHEKQIILSLCFHVPHHRKSALLIRLIKKKTIGLKGLISPNMRTRGVAVILEFVHILLWDAIALRTNPMFT